MTKNGADPRYRICTQCDETIDHLISRCPTLDPNEYLNRHNRVAQYLRWKICKHYGAQHAEYWYEHQSEAVRENDNVTILRDCSTQTDRKIKANKPNITVNNKKEKACKLIDLKISADKNVSVAELEKLSKYKDLEVEVGKLWHMKTVTIPAVIGALGMIKKGTEKHLERIPGRPNLAEMPKNSPYRKCSYPKENLIYDKLNIQKLINYPPYLYLHSTFILFILFNFYPIYCYL